MPSKVLVVIKNPRKDDGRGDCWCVGRTCTVVEKKATPDFKMHPYLKHPKSNFIVIKTDNFRLRKCMCIASSRCVKLMTPKQLSEFRNFLSLSGQFVG